MKIREEIPTKMVNEYKVGLVTCPRCGRRFYFIHCEGSNPKHKLKEIKE
jgi:uncharacterized Zn finger protein (UPF0148 family)